MIGGFIRMMFFGSSGSAATGTISASAVAAEGAATSASGTGGGAGGSTDDAGITVSALEIKREIGGRIAFLILF